MKKLSPQSKADSFSEYTMALLVLLISKIEISYTASRHLYYTVNCDHFTGSGAHSPKPCIRNII